MAKRPFPGISATAFHDLEGAPEGLPGVLFFFKAANNSGSDAGSVRYTPKLHTELFERYLKLKSGDNFNPVAHSLDVVSKIPISVLRYLIKKGGAAGMAIDPQEYENEFGCQIPEDKRKACMWEMEKCAAFVYQLHLGLRVIRRKRKRARNGWIDWKSEGDDIARCLQRAVRSLQNPFKPNTRYKKAGVKESSECTQVPLAVKAIDVLLLLADELQRVPKRHELKARLVELHPNLPVEKKSGPLKERKKTANSIKTFWSEQLKIAGLSKLK